MRRQILTLGYCVLSAKSKAKTGYLCMITQGALRKFSMRSIFKNTIRHNAIQIVNKLMGKERPRYHVDWIVRQNKHMSKEKQLDRWYRLWRVIETATDFKRPVFENKRVAEIGCGPLLGLGPLAIFCGAKSFAYLEPSFQKEVLTSPIMEERYFFPVHQELVANFGPRMSYANFIKSLRTCEIFDFVPRQTDLVISNSVLEHVHVDEIKLLLEKIASSASDQAMFMHAVDFGCHGVKGAPNTFGDMYQLNERPDISKWGINGLRVRDLMEELELSNWDTVDKVIYRKSEFNPERVNNYWNKYTQEELSSRVVLFVGQKNSN